MLWARRAPAGSGAGAATLCQLVHSCRSALAVHGCEPELGGLEGLVAQLNCGSGAAGGLDFSGFVRAVRREFQGVVQREMAAAAC